MNNKKNIAQLLIIVAIIIQGAMICVSFFDSYIEGKTASEFLILEKTHLEGITRLSLSLASSSVFEKNQPPYLEFLKNYKESIKNKITSLEEAKNKRRHLGQVYLAAATILVLCVCYWRRFLEDELTSQPRHEDAKNKRWRR